MDTGVAILLRDQEGLSPGEQGSEEAADHRQHERRDEKDQDDSQRGHEEPGQVLGPRHGPVEQESPQHYAGALRDPAVLRERGCDILRRADLRTSWWKNRG